MGVNGGVISPSSKSFHCGTNFSSSLKYKLFIWFIILVRVIYGTIHSLKATMNIFKY